MFPLVVQDFGTNSRAKKAVRSHWVVPMTGRCTICDRAGRYLKGIDKFHSPEQAKVVLRAQAPPSKGPLTLRYRGPVNACAFLAR